MVKGNWERRAELASQRRLEAKEKKTAKKQGKLVSIESILNKLKRDDQLISSGAKVEIFLADPDESLVCRIHFRTEECNSKKCRYSHDCVTIAHLSNTNGATDDMGKLPHEKRCLPPVLLSSINSGACASAVMFISVDNECVFDHEDPGIWNQWITRHNQRNSVDNRGHPGEDTREASRLPVCYEAEEEDDDDDEGLDGGGKEVNYGDHKRSVDHPETCELSEVLKNVHFSISPIHTMKKVVGRNYFYSNYSNNKGKCADSDSDSGEAQAPARGFKTGGSRDTVAEEEDSGGLVVQAPLALFCICTYLDNTDLFTLMAASSSMKSVLMHNRELRTRRKEALSSGNAAHEAMKKKREEKRKRSKRAAMGTDKKDSKKDAFARGGRTGR
jgi:hypothetical protein